MNKYSIARLDSGAWIWLGDGDDQDGCWADLDDRILDAADEGYRGLMEVEGETYRIDTLED